MIQNGIYYHVIYEMCRLESLLLTEAYSDCLLQLNQACRCICRCMHTGVAIYPEHCHCSHTCQRDVVQFTIRKQTYLKGKDIQLTVPEIAESAAATVFNSRADGNINCKIVISSAELCSVPQLWLCPVHLIVHDYY